MSQKLKNLLIKQLVDKSREAFIMGLEIFNKPTLKYRVEGFAFFVCNAWGLMLKAEMIKRHGEASIYYSDSPDRTLALSVVVGNIFTNDKDPLRKNLEKIIDLRNTSTHYITEEYGVIYTPLFQSCILNFRNKMNEFHNLDIAEGIPESFLTLSMNVSDFSDDALRAKYSAELAEKLITNRDDLAILEKEESNPKFSIGIKQEIYITKKKGSADFVVAYDSTSGNKVRTIKELQDPSNTHNYSFGNVVKEINKRIKKDGIPFQYSQPNGTLRNSFTKGDLTLFNKYYDIKSNKKYCYEHKSDGKTISFSYSATLIEFILTLIKKDPSGVIEALKLIGKSR